MYGLIMVDGILCGASPAPIVVPINDFSIVGNGPCISFKVSCVSTAIASNLTLAPTGSYSEITDIFPSLRTFSFNIDVHYPTASVSNVSFSTSWVKQHCYVEGQLGRYFFYYIKIKGVQRGQETCRLTIGMCIIRVNS